MTSALLQLAGITAMLVGAFAALGLLFRVFSGQLMLDIRARRRAREGDVPPPAAPRPVEAVPAGAPQVRRLGLQAAYDDVLAEAAALLAVPHALGTVRPGFARDVERLRLQTALSDAGLVVR
ncbi:hypothetical protein SAMN05660657_05260 [Geodermatophilus amargosae]|uniref:Uncharacterized protein n=1 Tax=Geodermatophilus amargosae TaxID=1296565 RepID=A0A1I7D3F4_9ACTN|nr:hypothetical protein [Geodermatophilus amargosae]SFU06167.1 hypothetical protein SAMN05660657_05260 [Geodermatophilus amargosae]